MTKEETDDCGFQTLRVLSHGKYDTKPNMSRFLKQHVTSIRISTLQKIELWPKIHYDIGKAIIRFRNNSDIIKDFSEKPYRYYFFDGLQEIDLKDKDTKSLEDFFDKLMEFRFIRDGNDDVKVFSIDNEKLNEIMEEERKNC